MDILTSDPYIPIYAWIKYFVWNYKRITIYKRSIKFRFDVGQVVKLFYRHKTMFLETFLCINKAFYLAMVFHYIRIRIHKFLSI